MVYNVVVTEVVHLVAMPGQGQPNPRERIVFGPKTLTAPDRTVALILIGQEIKLKDIDPANLEVSIVPFNPNKINRKRSRHDDDDDDC